MEEGSLYGLWLPAAAVETEFDTTHPSKANLFEQRNPNMSEHWDYKSINTIKIISFKQDL